MNDQDDQWGDKLEAYIDAYVEEEREDEADAALAAYVRFEGQGNVRSIGGWMPRRGAVIAGAAAAMAAGLAGFWLWSGRPLDPASESRPGRLASDIADTGGEDQVAVPIEPAPKRVKERGARRAGPIVEDLGPPPPAEPVPEPEPPAEVEKRRPKRAAQQHSEASQLSRELESLRALREAARASDYARALRLSREHRKAFAEPTLAAERDLIEIEALCGLDRLAEVRAAKHSFAKRHKHHHLRVKAEEMCGKKLAPPQKGEPSRHQEE